MSLPDNMSLQKNVLCLVDARGESAGTPGIRVNPLHQRPMGLADRLLVSPRLKPQEVISLLFGHRARLAHAIQPRVTIRLSVRTPSGKPAIQISL